MIEIWVNILTCILVQLRNTYSEMYLIIATLWKSNENLIFFAVRWCTVSDAEEQKCLDLAGNTTAKNIRGQLLCVRGQSPTDCMKQIKVVENCFRYGAWKLQ